MILVRLVFQVKFGKINEVLAGFKQSANIISRELGQNARYRILTDLSGPFNILVQEIIVESLADWEKQRIALFSHPVFQQAQEATLDLIESGRTEFFTIET